MSSQTIRRATVCAMVFSLLTTASGAQIPDTNASPPPNQALDEFPATPNSPEPALTAFDSGCVECDTMYLVNGHEELWTVWEIDLVTGVALELGFLDYRMFDIGINLDGDMAASGWLGLDLSSVDLCDVGSAPLVGVAGIPVNSLGGDRTSTDLYVAGPPLGRVESTAPYDTEILGGAVGDGPNEWCGLASGDLTFDPMTNELYVTLAGCVGCPGADMLARVNPDTGDIIANVGCIDDAASSPIANVYGLAFSSDGTLWGISGDMPDKLLEIDTSSADVTSMLTIVGGPDDPAGLALLPCPATSCEPDLTNPEIDCGLTLGSCDAPSDVGAPSLTVDCGEPFCVAADASDDCGLLTLSTDQTPLVTATVPLATLESYTETLNTPGVYTISWTAQDENGNQKSCEATVDVRCDGCTIPPGEMQAWWRLDVSLGDTLDPDAAPTDFFDDDGSFSGSPAPTPGAVDGSLCFDGIDDAVVVPHSSEIMPTGDSGGWTAEDFSIDLWVNTEVVAGRQVLLDKRAPGQVAGQVLGYMLFLENGFVGLYIGDGSINDPACDPDPALGTCTEWIATTDPVADGMWHQIAVTVDRFDSSGGRIWIDGAPVLTFDPTPRTDPMENFYPLLIGFEHPDFGGSAFTGCLDEVEFFKRVLSPEEIAALWAAGSDGKCKCDGPNHTAELLCPPGETEFDVDGDGCPDICVCDAYFEGGCEGLDYSQQCLSAPSCAAGEIVVDNDCNGTLEACEPCPPGTYPVDTNGDGCFDTCECGFVLVIDVDVDVITWPNGGGGGPTVGTDTTTGSLDDLNTFDGDFAVATIGCLGSTQGQQNSIPHGADPPPGEGYWYLVRPKTAAGNGSYDPPVPGWAAGRDAEIAASGRDCR